MTLKLILTFLYQEIKQVNKKQRKLIKTINLRVLSTPTLSNIAIIFYQQRGQTSEKIEFQNTTVTCTQEAFYTKSILSKVISICHRMEGANFLYYPTFFSILEHPRGMISFHKIWNFISYLRLPLCVIVNDCQLNISLPFQCTKNL